MKTKPAIIFLSWLMLFCIICAQVAACPPDPPDPPDPPESECPCDNCHICVNDKCIAKFGIGWCCCEGTRVDCEGVCCDGTVCDSPDAECCPRESNKCCEVGSSCCDDKTCYDNSTDECCKYGTGQTCDKNKQCCYGTCCDPDECETCVDGECLNCNERFGDCCKCEDGSCTPCKCWDEHTGITGNIHVNDVGLCGTKTYTSSASAT